MNSRIVHLPNILKISIIQNNDNEYLNWSGECYINIDLNFSSQQVDDIVLYPPSNYKNGKNNKSVDLTNFIIYIILILILLTIITYIIYMKRK